MVDKVKVQELDSPTRELLAKLYTSQPRFVRFGDIGCLMPITYNEIADKFKNMIIRPDDTWVVTFPRSGTTWTQELVWLLKNDLDYDTASKTSLNERYFFIEVNWAIHLDKGRLEVMDPAVYEKVKKTRYTYEDIVDGPSPRFLKTHIPLSLLPSSLLDTTKVIYVARDPRDVAVSFHYLMVNTPFFGHLKEAWALRHHRNLLFTFYEDLIKDLPSSIKRIATFLGKEITNEETVKLSDHLNIKNFKKNQSVNPDWFNQKEFVRKGISGGWREHFDKEMTAQAQSWMRENLAGSDLRFPDASS